eukprot:285154-Chlamydomonas_euryale.AAC.2
MCFKQALGRSHLQRSCKCSRLQNAPAPPPSPSLALRPAKRQLAEHWLAARWPSARDHSLGCMLRWPVPPRCCWPESGGGRCVGWRLSPASDLSVGWVPQVTHTRAFERGSGCASAGTVARLEGGTYLENNSDSSRGSRLPDQRDSKHLELPL